MSKQLYCYKLITLLLKDNGYSFLDYLEDTKKVIEEELSDWNDAVVATPNVSSELAGKVRAIHERKLLVIKMAIAAYKEE